MTGPKKRSGFTLKKTIISDMLCELYYKTELSYHFLSYFISLLSIEILNGQDFYLELLLAS